MTAVLVALGIYAALLLVVAIGIALEKIDAVRRRYITLRG